MSNDAESIESKKTGCRLGVNKKTGRLQWCPNCSCTRILIAIPATIMPIVLVFLLLTHFDLAGTVKHEPRRFDFEKTDKNLEESQQAHCVAIRAQMSEVFDVEDRELMKDIRTSFIPSQPLILPVYCKELLKSNEAKIQNELNLLNYIHRRKRRHEPDPENGTVDTLSSNDFTTTTEDSITSTDLNPSNFSTDFNSDLNLDPNEQTSAIDAPWQVSDAGDDSNTELDELEKACPDCLSGATSIHSFWKGEGTAENIRSTQAEVMRQYIDESVDPCVDFYQYSCGNWEKLNPIPKDKAAFDTFEKLRESLDTVLRDLLLEHPSTQNLTVKEEVIPTKKPSQESITVPEVGNSLDLASLLQRRLTLRHQLRRRRRNSRFSRRRRGLTLQNLDDPAEDAEKKARDLFLSCMNYDLIEKRGIDPIHKLLKSLGGWPVLENNWDPNNFDWLNLTAQLRLYNNDIFLLEWVGPDIKNSDENVIQFDQTVLGLPTRDYFLKETNRAYLEAYREYMITVMHLLGADYVKAVQTVDEVINFEINLANITSSPEERSNVSVLYRRVTLEELKEDIPGIDWERYLTTVLEHPIPSNETIVMFATDYMKNLVKLIQSSDPTTVANYQLWRFIRHRVNNVDDRFNEAKQRFYFALFGREESPPRWKNCVNQVNSNMGMAVGAMFVRRYFDENSKSDTMEITHELQQAFRDILNSTDWIDPNTKLLAEQKVNAMSLRIGYPDFILSHEELNEKYKDLHIDPNEYFENTLNVLRHLTKSEQSKLGQVVNKTAWNTAPAVVNAYYSRNKNQIMFPAGILQPPFYHRFFPKSLNYGGIGVVIGHELTHGFDDKGRLFDREGNLHRWWSDQAIDGFHERAKCLIEQYGNYTVKEVGIAVDGENTQGENIADNGGIKQAFKSYQKWLQQQQDPKVLENEQLPGLNATGMQLFFLNFAQVWCGAMRPEASRNKLKTAVHSPGKFRVIGTLSNMPDFAEVYQCPLGSPMNPIKKCTVW